MGVSYGGPGVWGGIIEKKKPLVAAKKGKGTKGPT